MYLFSEQMKRTSVSENLLNSDENNISIAQLTTSNEEYVPPENKHHAIEIPFTTDSSPVIVPSTSEREDITNTNNNTSSTDGTTVDTGITTDDADMMYIEPMPIQTSPNLKKTNSTIILEELFIEAEIECSGPNTDGDEYKSAQSEPFVINVPDIPEGDEMPDEEDNDLDINSASVVSLVKEGKFQGALKENDLAEDEKQAPAAFVITDAQARISKIGFTDDQHLPLSDREIPARENINDLLKPKPYAFQPNYNSHLFKSMRYDLAFRKFCIEQIFIGLADLLVLILTSISFVSLVRIPCYIRVFILMCDLNFGGGYFCEFACKCSQYYKQWLISREKRSYLYLSLLLNVMIAISDIAIFLPMLFISVVSITRLPTIYALFRKHMSSSACYKKSDIIKQYKFSHFV